MQNMENESGAADAQEDAAEQGAPKGLDQATAEQITEELGNRAMEVVNKMQELGFILSKMGMPQEQVQQLAGHFEAFVQTLKAILGGESAPEGEMQQEDAPAPEPNKPVDQMSGGKGVPVM